MQSQTIIFLGPQGCGKGTQLKLLAAHLSKADPNRNILKPAMGALARSFAERDTYASSLLRLALQRGDLVEYAVSVTLIGNYLLEHTKGDEHLLIDGFPRSIEQVAFLDSAVRFYKRQNPTVVRIEISDDEAQRRLALRHRSDDTPESIRARLSWTRKAEKTIEEWFRANPVYRFLEVNGEQTIEAVHADVLKTLGFSV